MGSGSLLEFASKRARLAGKSILDSGNPWFVPLDRLRSDAQSRGRSLVSFANYDYLGLSDRPEIKKASAEALERHGAGALGSRLVGGERSMHSEFEHAVADFIGVEASLTLVSGYLKSDDHLAPARCEGLASDRRALSQQYRRGQEREG